MSFHSKLIDLLKTDSRFLDEDGELVTRAVLDRAWKIDHQLVKSLISDSEIKSKFFDEIEGHWIFNVNTFVEYISQKNFLDNSYTRFRNKIGLTIGDKYLSERGEVALVWPYKDCVLEGGQTKEEETRKEIFFNEVLAQDEISRLLDPKVLTNFRRFTANGEDTVSTFRRDENGQLNENLLVKGNNLLSLHCLKTQFRSRVKLVYIDPPFNPDSAANTFSYNNRFNHSTWLTFMMNRIAIARELLTSDGMIAVAIDHYELFYLGAICDEVFGRKNRMGIVSVVHNPGGRQDDAFFATAHENMLVYAKDIQKVSLNPLNIAEEKLSQFQYEDEFGKYKLRGFRRSGNNSERVKRPRLFYPIYYNHSTKELQLSPDKGFVELLPIDKQGVERCWRWSSSTFASKLRKYIEVKKLGDGFEIYIKERESDYLGEKPKTVWSKPYYSGQTATNELKKIFGARVFNYPKSPYLMMDIIRICTTANDLVLDFFGGSGTTAHAVLELERLGEGARKFILCEQMDYVESITLKRIREILGIFGQGSVTYFELMRYNQSYIEKILNATSVAEIIKLYDLLSTATSLNWYISPEDPIQARVEFEKIGSAENGLERQKHLLLQLLDKNQLYVNLTEIEDEQFKVSDEDKALNKAFYGDAYNG